MLPSDMNLQIGKIENYNNKILVSSSNFNIGTNLMVNLGDDKHIEKGTCKPDVKSRKEENDDDKHIQLSLQYGGFANDLFPSRFCHRIRVYQNSDTGYKCPQILR